MTDRIVIDPLTRIEGHLKIEVVVEDGRVKEARSSGMLFRGLELILQGRDPRDAQRITQRICGVCPTTHSLASALALDAAFGIAADIPANGRIIRNLIQGANYIQSHILHFYHLAALDYVDVAAVADYHGSDPVLNSVKDFIERGVLAPFVPRYEGDYRLSPEVNRAAVAHYVQALDMRRLAHEMLAVFGGKMPHNMAVVPGGVTEVVTEDKVVSFYWKLQTLRRFIDNVYIPDVLAVAEAYADYFEIGAGCGNYLAYGGLDLDSHPDLTQRQRFLTRGTTSAVDLTPRPLDPERIREDVGHSRYRSGSGLHPSQGQTEPEPHKEGGYSWIKAPRYDGQVYEVGPLARILVAYAQGMPQVRELVDGVLAHFGASPTALFSVLGRHAARALETKLVADAMAEWVLELRPGEPVCAEYTLPQEGEGMGLWEAPRGALGHWISIKDGVIANYQCVVPTTWNCSPRDDQGRPGPVEQALEGTEVRDKENPFELVRIVRSFDPCIACAVHLVTPRGTELARFRVG
ncbi:MAG TPA: nickel-dependent hydrogenase large subunit [Anaerolineales bacterium]|nr:nickel-dependent hydrogenase large subunit [Anaerolineae bacterium]HIQ01987.1 nickel-dependent hydrogenase large subunit [Anaerolineales bacterium]